MRKDGITGIERLRRELGLSQADLALLAGTTQFRVSEIEHGLQPSPEQLRALCSALGVPESLDQVLLVRVRLLPEVPPPPDMKERLLAMRAAKERA